MQVFLTASEIENHLLNLFMILIRMLWLCKACKPSYFCILDVLNYLLSTVYKNLHISDNVIKGIFLGKYKIHVIDRICGKWLIKTGNNFNLSLSL